MNNKKVNSHNSKIIPFESLPEMLQMVAEVLSTKDALKLSECFGGICLYIPKIEGLLRRHRDERIRNEFNGANIRNLARKYKLSERQVRTIVQKRSKTLR